MMRTKLVDLRREAEQELLEILDWWRTHLRSDQGGFHGEVNLRNEANEKADRSLVLYTRILWTFSAAITHRPNAEYRAIADEAYAYLLKHFQDPDYGGFYWSVDASGSVVHDHKQLYGQAFTIYAFSEYHVATGNQQALALAIDLFDLIEAKGADSVQEGYWEVCDRAWRVLKGNRLSEKDLPADKSMNTHLHLLEAYTRLASCTENDRVGGALDRLLRLYMEKIIDPATYSQFLYFAADWTPLTRTRSFGHDVEASWLLYEAAVQLNNPLLSERIGTLSVEMLEATASALDIDGGILYEYDPETDHLNREKHWWPQAEGLVGYLNAFQLTGDEKYVNGAWKIWSYVRKAIKHPKGEWVWGRDENGAIMESIKAGFWKCPYHNGRACLELIHRIDHLLTESTPLL